MIAASLPDAPDGGLSAAAGNGPSPFERSIQELIEPVAQVFGKRRSAPCFPGRRSSRSISASATEASLPRSMCTGKPADFPPILLTLDIGMNDIDELQRRMEGAGDLADPEEGILLLRLAATPEFRDGFLRPHDIGRMEHLPVHVDIDETEPGIP